MAQTVAGFATLKESVLGVAEDHDRVTDGNQLEAEFEFLDEKDLEEAAAEEGINEPDV